MLDALFGNRNITRILLFLFVNGRCYGSQLHRLLKTSLTPLQKALLRLEKGGLITSYLEGKTRLYQFNPAFPLLAELEQLLKMAYTLMPASEKKEYYVVRDEYVRRPPHLENRNEVLLAFWERLSSVKRLTFAAKSKSKEGMGWNGKGKGEVFVAKESGNVLVFNEKGHWQGKEGTKGAEGIEEAGDVDFTNVFRWTLDREAGVVSLEHLRRGPDHPVFLFDMAPSGRHSLSSVDSHLCVNDTYLGQIQFDKHGFCLHWRIIGPNKNEELSYFYS